MRERERGQTRPLQLLVVSAPRQTFVSTMERFHPDKRPDIVTRLIERDGPYCMGTRKDGSRCLRPLWTLQPNDIHVHHRVPVRPMCVRERESEQPAPDDISVMCIHCRSCHKIATDAEEKLRQEHTKTCQACNENRIINESVCVRESSGVRASEGGQEGASEPDQEPAPDSAQAPKPVGPFSQYFEGKGGAPAKGTPAKKKIHRSGPDSARRSTETGPMRANRKRELPFVKFVYDLMWTPNRYDPTDIKNAGAQAIGGSPVAYARYMDKLTNPINGPFVVVNNSQGKDYLDFRDEATAKLSRERYEAKLCLLCGSKSNDGKVMCDECAAKYSDE